jgi:hypothetical protein
VCRTFWTEKLLDVQPPLKDSTEYLLCPFNSQLQPALIVDLEFLSNNSNRNDDELYMLIRCAAGVN